MLNWKIIGRDVAIIWLLTAAGGFVVGAMAGLLLGPNVMANPKVQLGIAFSNIVFGIIGFAIVGTLKKIDRFKHLFIVAVGAWLVSALNIFLPTVTLAQWLFGGVVLLVLMCIGGGISFLFAPFPKAPNEARSN